MGRNNGLLNRWPTSRAEIRTQACGFVVNSESHYTIFSLLSPYPFHVSVFRYSFPSSFSCLSPSLVSFLSFTSLIFVFSFISFTFPCMLFFYSFPLLHFLSILPLLSLLSLHRFHLSLLSFTAFLLLSLCPSDYVYKAVSKETGKAIINTNICVLSVYMQISADGERVRDCVNDRWYVSDR